jgi:hypothetical protein
MDGLPFRKIDGVSGLALRGQPLRACYLGRLFRVDRLRNAYFGRPSQSWYIDCGFHPSLEDAKESVEEMRAKGSHWLITERPAVVLCFDRFGISVCTSTPFDHFATQNPEEDACNLASSLRPSGNTTAIEDVDALVLRVDPAIEGARAALGSEGSCNLSVPNIAFTTWRTGSDNFTPVLEFTPFCRQ